MTSATSIRLNETIENFLSSSRCSLALYICNSWCSISPFVPLSFASTNIQPIEGERERFSYLHWNANGTMNNKPHHRMKKKRRSIKKVLLISNAQMERRLLLKPFSISDDKRFKFTCFPSCWHLLYWKVMASNEKKIALKWTWNELKSHWNCLPNGLFAT